jgi:hypothetical protein
MRGVVQSHLLLVLQVQIEKPRKDSFQIGYDILWNLVIRDVQEPHLDESLVELLQESRTGRG